MADGDRNTGVIVDQAVGASGLLDRTLARLRRVWRDLPSGTRRGLSDSLDPSLRDSDLVDVQKAMAACIEARSGDVAARHGAAELGKAYLSLNDEGRRRFLKLLGSAFASRDEDVDVAMAAVSNAPDPAARAEASRNLAVALEAPRIKLLRQFNSLPQGIKFLVDLRAEIRAWVDEDPALGALEGDLRDLLASWFDIGLLDLSRITWDSPASLLERLIEYEAVHEIRSWSDLKNRLDSDRRCFAFFHPSMPNEPLIFVEVALVSGMADNVHMLLDEAAPAADPAQADTAIFYSISNAQAGLAGISFGNFLIKRVVADLGHEFPRLKTFATLSPIPGFRRWLSAALADEVEDLVLPPESRSILRDLLDQDWAANPEQSEALRGPLVRLAAQYLLSVGGRKRARDPVAHFHLANGARLERINWLADRSPKGLRQSCGMMVNYLYRLAEIDTNQSRYAESGTIRASNGVRALLNG